MKRGSRLNPRSKKTQALYAERRVLVANLLSGFPRCEWPGCLRFATNVHEAWTRARSGSDPHAITCRDNCHVLCDEHGGVYPHVHEDEAREHGLMRKSWEGCVCGHRRTGT